jgi:ribonucleotide reductase beta subunit family protein with ferritin-like domain
MDDEIDYSDELFDIVIKQGRDDDEARSIIFKAIFATYTLEHIKFPFSFYSTWNLNRVYGNAVQGFSMLLKLIAQDELDFHVPMNKNVLKILKRETRQGFKNVWDEEFAYWYVKKVAEAEKKWSDYLLAEGEVPGFSRGINNNFIEYFANKTLTDLGLKEIYKAEKTDAIDWYNEYRKINNQNAALQEVSNVSYNKGVVKNDILTNLDELRKCVKETHVQ